MSTKLSTVAHKAKVLVLGDDTTSPAERHLVHKLDFFILTYCSLSFFFNYLDRAAFANAYVSGLKEDLHLSGNDYSALLSMTTAGYVLGQVPHGLIIQKVPPRIWLPSMVVVWAGLTMVAAACRNYEQLCAVRFFQGLVEASTYSGTIYIIGSWYKPREIAKRVALFTASGNAGQMFAGVMMSAIWKSLDGRLGLAGWQWVFIIDGVITLPIAIMGFMYFPDIPEITKAPYLSTAERELAVTRLTQPKREDGHNIAPWSLIQRVFTCPAFYILCLFGILCSALEAFCSQGLFLLWLKSHASEYSQVEINRYPLGIQAVAITANLAAAIYIDATGHRVAMGILACILQLTSSIILIIPNVSTTATFFAYYNAGTAYIVNPLLFGWTNVIMQRGGDHALRSVVITSINAFGQILYTFWGIVLYSAEDAPYWRNGSIGMMVVVGLLLCLLFVVKGLDEHTAKQHPDQQVTETEDPKVVRDLEDVEMTSRDEKGMSHVTARPAQRADSL